MSKAPATRARRSAAKKSAPPPRGRRAVLLQGAQWVSLLARVLLAVVLGWAGFLKMLDPLTSARAVRAYQILPESVVPTVGYGLPFLEVVLALILLVGVVSRYAGIVAGLIQIAFIIAIASVWARGISIGCGCFGGGGQVDPGQTQYPLDILRDIGLTVAAAWIAVFPPGRFAVDRLLFRD